MQISYSFWRVRAVMELLVSASHENSNRPGSCLYETKEFEFYPQRLRQLVTVWVCHSCLLNTKLRCHFLHGDT